MWGFSHRCGADYTCRWCSAKLSSVSGDRDKYHSRNIEDRLVFNFSQAVNVYCATSSVMVRLSLLPICLTVSHHRNEPSLDKVLIVCERFGDTVVFHNLERNAVSMAPFFIFALVVEFESLFKLLATLRHDCSVGMMPQALNQLGSDIS